MNGFVVTVDFRLKRGAMAAFGKLIDENAQMSCERQPGCGRFAVLRALRRARIQGGERSHLSIRNP